jgi:hypothetical protein
MAEPGLELEDAAREGGGRAGDLRQNPCELRGPAGLAILAVRRAQLVPDAPRCRAPPAGMAWSARVGKLGLGSIGGTSGWLSGASRT